LVEGLGVFERNRVPLELKILGLAFSKTPNTQFEWVV
jgi:hypothetical protein